MSATPSPAPTDWRVFVAGAGAVGGALALALGRRGWPLAEIACRTQARARERLAQIEQTLRSATPATQAAPAAPAAPVAVDWSGLCSPDRPTGAHRALLLVSVPDRAVARAAAELARRRWPADSVALHTSGAVEVAELQPLRAAGLAVGGLHPLKSFVDLERDAGSLGGVVMAIEGDPAALALAHALATQLGGQPFLLQPGARPAWHAAASHACNHLVALLDQSLDLAQRAGLARDEARQALLSLQRGTLDNLAAQAPAGALTGPIVRGELATLERHIAVLASAPPDVAAAYRALGRRAVALARQRGLTDAVASALLAALQDPSP